ncbi:hypothetical protein, partial [Adlercreutzia sp. ZJ473]|uniref:hypothetical protein n=1 Tax=Adlercreutzia sp. ZJ473 TaxID=2722822 RepID=UPI001C131141
LVRAPRPHAEATSTRALAQRAGTRLARAPKPCPRGACAPARAHVSPRLARRLDVSFRTIRFCYGKLSQGPEKRCMSWENNLI